MQHLAAEVGILPLQVIFRLLGGDDHGAADGVRAVQGGAGSLGHLDLLDVIEIEAETAHLVVEVVGAEAVADPDPILMISTRLPPMPRMLMFCRPAEPVTETPGSFLNTSVSSVAIWRSRSSSVMTVMEPEMSDSFCSTR